MRLALVAVLVLGLVPALGEVAETLAHYVVAGHLAHTEADAGDLGEQGDEHGCGATHHVCGCCASQAFAAAPSVSVTGPASPGPSRPAAVAPLASLHEPAAPFRPPIAS